MSHPALVTLDDRSAPRVLVSGEQLREFSLPTGTRVLYPRRPLRCEEDVASALRNALERPCDSAPLRARLKPGMCVTIALDAQFVGVPQAGTQVSATALDVLLPLLTECGVTNVRIIVATGVHRRLRPHELRYLLGRRIYEHRINERVELHDPEAACTMVQVGSTTDGLPIELNRTAAESDLLVAVAVTAHPLAGSQTTCALGLGGYANTRAVYAPDVRLGTSGDYSKRISCVFDVIASAVPVFGIEFTLDSRYQASAFDFLHKNEDDLTGRDRLRLYALGAATRRLPSAACATLLSRVAPRAGTTGVFAGSCGGAHERALVKYFEQHAVPIRAQADVLVMGLGPIGPFNQGAFLNPLLVSHLAQAWVFSQCPSEPLVRTGGTLILLHPCTDRFDHEQHTPYIEFVRQLLTETADSHALHARYEQQFAQDPALVEMFRTGHAYHPAHPFMLWYQCEPARRHYGRVIVVGADNEYVPNLLGYETAPNLDEALYRARKGHPHSQDILCLHNFPTAVGQVSSSRSMT